jgi:hypothetical protein
MMCIGRSLVTTNITRILVEFRAGAISFGMKFVLSRPMGMN